MAGDIISFPGRTSGRTSGLVEHGVSALVQEVVDAHGVGRTGGMVIRELIDPGIGLSRAPAEQVRAIVNQLIQAMSESMDQGGELRLQASSVYQPELAQEQYLGLTPGHYALLLLDASCAESFAEDFALGVDLLHRVNTLAGKIDVSVVSQTQLSVALHLPLAARDQTTAAPGSTHILLVDDSEQVQSSVSDMLKQLGYRVTARSGAAEALDTLGRNPDDFQLLLSDITMPRISGVEMVARLQVIRSDLPVVFMTGFSADQHAGSATGVRGVLKKPFTLAELKAVLAQALLS